MWRNPKRVGCDRLLDDSITSRIDIESHRFGKEPAKSFQDAASEIAVVRFIEDLKKQRDAKRNPRAFNMPRGQILRKAMERPKSLTKTIMFTADNKSIRARKSLFSTFPRSRRLFIVISMISSMSSDASLPQNAVACLPSNISRARTIISRLSRVTGAHRPRSISTFLWRITSDASSDVPVSPNNVVGVAPIRTRCSAKSRLSMAPQTGPRTIIQSISNRSWPMSSKSASMSLRGVLPMVKSTVDQIHVQSSDRLLLERIGGIEHPSVNDDIARVCPGCVLKTHPHPRMALIAAGMRKGRRSVGQCKKSRTIPSSLIEAIAEQAILVIEHFLHAFPRHIPQRFSIDRVADCHVVGRYRFGYRRARRSTDGKNQRATSWPAPISANVP